MANIFEKNKIYLGNCLEIMPTFPDGVFDMILCDLPYGTTEVKWDSIIDLKKLWEQYERLIKPSGAIVLTASQPFTSLLVMSNTKLFKYSLVWRKTRIQGFAQAPYRFMTEHEDILVFSKGGCAKNANIRMVFNPQNLIYKPRVSKGKKANASEHRIRKTDQKDFVSEWTNYPKSILEIGSEFNSEHPTQKPVELFEYLIRTYTKENELILDNCAGSGTTGIACMNTNRNYVMIEKEEKYFDLILKRVDKNILIKKDNEAQTSLWNTANGI